MNAAVNRTALVMAAGTGGHIFPALAVADALKARGWHIVWLGTPQGMENRLVAQHGYPLVHLNIKGVRGNGVIRLLKTPFMLLKSVMQAKATIRREKPAVAVGFGGYVGFPGALAARLCGVPLVVHEQNAIAGLTNKLTARFAARVLQAFPGAFADSEKLETVGNPVRQQIAALPEPSARYSARTGPLRLLVVGGSLGAQVLNQTVPAALALLSAEQRPTVVHQSGEKHLAALEESYRAAGVTATPRAFIEDMAAALADADLVICRAGALTVSELAAVGVAGLFVPLPHAVDDHQTANARFLTDVEAGWLVPQSELSADWLADFLSSLSREELMRRAENARARGMTQATERVVAVCEDVAK